MRERQFVDQNLEKWQRFESFAEGKSHIGPEELGELYASITDDLSYARTYYTKRSIRVYLNNLAQKTYLNLHKQRTTKRESFRNFWLEELPLALYQARKELNLSLLFFILSMGIGVLSSIHDADFAGVILGNDYVRMTEENIRSGEPMGVYKQAAEIDMFLRITLNNLLVAFRTFVLGAFFGIGSLIIMLYNGIMVGTFQYFFIERGLFTDSFLTIWMHGALEISAIVIAGGAGLTMGRGLLFPGTLPRLQSFQLSARRALKIMLGLVPVFIAAAFIEGFFTRLTEVPNVFRGGFIFASFAFVGLYFWWLPYSKFRHTPSEELREEDLLSPLPTEVHLPVIRKSKEVFTTSFSLYRLNLPTILAAGAVLALLYTGAFRLIYGSEGVNNINFTKMATFNLKQFHSYGTFFWNFFLNVGLISSVCWVVFRKFRTSDGVEDNLKPYLAGPRLFLKICVIVTLFELFILSGNGLVAALGILFIPYFTLLMVVSAVEGLALPDAFSRMLALLNGTRRYPFMTFLSLGMLSILMLLLLDSPFTWFYIDVLQWNIEAEDETKVQLALLSLLFLNQLGLSIVLPLTVYGQILEYYSACEIRDGKELAKDVSHIGLRRRAYGMESEQ